MECLQTITSYNPNGIPPIKLFQQFPKDVPIAFIISKVDVEVPIQGAFNKLKALNRSGHKKIHLLILNHSSHNGYTWEHPEDKRRYK